MASPKPSVDLPPFCVEPASAPRAVCMGLCSQSKRNLASRAVQNVPSLGEEGRRSALFSPERKTLMKMSSQSGRVPALCQAFLCSFSCIHEVGENPLVPPLVAVAISLCSGAVCGLFRSWYRSAAPTSSCWAGDMLSFSTVAGSEPTERNVGLPCKKASRV